MVAGGEEAELSFLGATRELAGTVPGPFCVVDIGGGSTEVVVGDVAPGGGLPEVRASLSVDVGCVRLTERHLHDDPPTPAQVRRPPGRRRGRPGPGGAGGRPVRGAGPWSGWPAR